MNKVLLILALLTIILVVLSTKVTPIGDTVHKVMFNNESQYERDKERYKTLRQLIESCDPVIVDFKLLQVCV